MKVVPARAILLAIVLISPFLWGVATRLSVPLQDWTLEFAGPRFVAPYLPLYYGTILLAFQSGVLWGFASRARDSVAFPGYMLSIIPLFWAFLFTGIGPQWSALALMAGFAGVLGIDMFFALNGLTPPWWLRVRVISSAVVIACLAVIAL